eukprot:CAMPEP_0118945288 /NCGR_PEP_ID=MMETSP1169-20130426/41964_1 /TAXON_ID=36882 /ORGANISM="Pyramimonas obovata, Strain CCMP722" /LENGTH=88 /DNA_ID=CAMNT_0006890967 /DNA_START=52 /DNA_END=314 /DNA_ORIENTATION=-
MSRSPTRRAMDLGRLEIWNPHDKKPSAVKTTEFKFQLDKQAAAVVPQPPSTPRPPSGRRPMANTGPSPRHPSARGGAAPQGSARMNTR